MNYFSGHKYIMMGHKEKMVSGTEYDALTRWKQYLHWNSGVRKYIKRQFNKRVRKKAKQDLAG